jgi:hypothetical protein
MAVKLVFSYNQFNQGWSETWYKAGDEFRAATALTPAQIAAFLQFRDPRVQLYTIRGSLIGTPRNAYLRVIQQGVLPNPALEYDPDVSATCALMRLMTTEGLSRHLWIRGLPDQFVVRAFSTGRSIPSAGFNSALDNFRSLLPNMGLCLQKLNGTAVNPWLNVTKMEPDDIFSQSTKVTLLAGSIGPQPGQRVLFKGISTASLPYFRSQYTVQRRVDDTHFTVNYPWQSPLAAYFPPNAYVRRVTYSYPQITEIDFERFATRDTGRPSVPSRGRRAAVKGR